MPSNKIPSYCYSYTANNPLKYIDPSGYKLGISAMAASPSSDYDKERYGLGGGGGISWPRMGTLETAYTPSFEDYYTYLEGTDGRGWFKYEDALLCGWNSNGFWSNGEIETLGELNAFGNASLAADFVGMVSSSDFRSMTSYFKAGLDNIFPLYNKNAQFLLTSGSDNPPITPANFNADNALEQLKYSLAYAYRFHSRYTIYSKDLFDFNSAKEALKNTDTHSWGVLQGNINSVKISLVNNPNNIVDGLKYLAPLSMNSSHGLAVPQDISFYNSPTRPMRGVDTKYPYAIRLGGTLGHIATFYYTNYGELESWANFIRHPSRY